MRKLICRTILSDDPLILLQGVQYMHVAHKKIFRADDHRSRRSGLMISIPDSKISTLNIIS
jgi:hypothetical protein